MSNKKTSKEESKVILKPKICSNNSIIYTSPIKDKNDERKIEKENKERNKSTNNIKNLSNSNDKNIKNHIEEAKFNFIPNKNSKILRKKSMDVDFINDLIGVTSETKEPNQKLIIYSENKKAVSEFKENFDYTESTARRKLDFNKPIISKMICNTKSNTNIQKETQQVSDKQMPIIDKCKKILTINNITKVNKNKEKEIDEKHFETEKEEEKNKNFLSNIDKGVSELIFETQNPAQTQSYSKQHDTSEIAKISNSLSSNAVSFNSNQIYLSKINTNDSVDFDLSNSQILELVIGKVNNRNEKKSKNSINKK